MFIDFTKLSKDFNFREFYIKERSSANWDHHIAQAFSAHAHKCSQLYQEFKQNSTEAKLKGYLECQQKFEGDLQRMANDESEHLKRADALKVG